MTVRTIGENAHRVVVVGAGLAGLSAALHLAGRGRAVTVVERWQHPGGRVGRLDVDGYQLDTGPTVLTMPDIIDDTFAAVGESLSVLGWNISVTNLRFDAEHVLVDVDASPSQKDGPHAKPEDIRFGLYGALAQGRTELAPT